MRLAFVISAILALAGGTSARADRILDRSSRWTQVGRFISTEMLVERDDGTIENVVVPGGTVDGIGMVQFPLFLGGSGPQLLAFVRSRTTSGSALRWTKQCVYVTPDAEGTTDIPGNREFGIIDSVLTVWETATASCTYLKFLRLSPEHGEVGYDGTNRIKFREDRWCRPATATEAEQCYEPLAAAITTLFFVDRPGAEDDGTIVDADIEINAVNFAVTDNDGATSGAGDHSDLANTLTHEVGHFIGLDHTCMDKMGTPPIDDSGNPIPSCFPESSLPDAIKDATMYNYQDAGETKKRSVEQDDIRGYCAIYPIGSDPGVCEPAIEQAVAGGCAACNELPEAPSGPAGGVAVLILALLAALLPFRRRG